jgi:hypothetical protein
MLDTIRNLPKADATSQLPGPSLRGAEALELREQIRTLPPFDETTAKTWAALAWEKLNFDCDGKPERYRDLRELAGGRVETKRDANEGAKAWRSRIRRKIGLRFRAAFERLAVPK